MEQYRQGDVLIQRIAQTSIPNTAQDIPKDRGRTILAYGEATGHAHVVEGDDVRLMVVNPKKANELSPRYLIVGDGGATVKHDEHGTIPLRPGAHRVIRQREYVPPAREEKQARARAVYD